MINRYHGFSHEDYKSTTIDIFPAHTVYEDDDNTDNNERIDRILAWAWRWTDRCKEQYPYCRFGVAARVHDFGRCDYVEIEILSPNGSHSEAAEWLKYKTARKES